jgi:probable F420-dependent oxidoreductase
MARFKVGVQLEPQHCAVEDLRRAWRNADAMGVDSVWTWDHFFPLWGDPEGTHYEGWTLLTAAACDTERASLGVLVSSMSYRSPDLLADMARTADHVSGGRMILGIGAGWNERDYDEYGFEFGTAAARCAALRAGLRRIRDRLARLNPPPLGPLPILVGGEGEEVTLRVAAELADAWNGFGPVERFVRKNGVLDRWCARTGRDPSEIERTVLLRDDDDLSRVDEFVAAGAQHLILPARTPFDLEPVRRLVERAAKEDR